VTSVPSFNVLASKYVMIFANFNKFQLYIFHNRTYSESSLAFIKKVNEIQTLEMISIIDTAKSIGINIEKDINRIKEIMNFAGFYKDSIEMKKVYERMDYFMDGFFENELEYLVYKTAFICVIFAVCKILFHLLYNYPVSIFFRKYYFYGTLLLLIFDGSLEEMSFFLSGEL